MRRANITTLTSNADTAALETARAALTNASGQAVLSGGSVSFSIEPASNEEFLSGDMVGFAYVGTTVTKDGHITARSWRRWAGGDFTIIPGAGMVVGPREVPPGAARVISLPLVVVDTAGSSTFACGTFLHVPSTVG